MRFFLLAGLLCALLASVGCQKSSAVEVVQYPKWQYADYKRIGVAPMKVSDKKGTKAANAATETLASDLTKSGYFDVVSTTEMREILREQDLSRLSDVSDPETAIPAGRIKRAQALIVGVITDFEMRTDSEKKRVPRYGTDNRGRLRIVKYDNVTEYRSYARVGGTVNIVDTATGERIFSHTVPPIELDDSATGQKPERSPEDLAMEGAQTLATVFYRVIAPQRMRVKFSENNLLVALDYFEGQYRTVKEVPPDAEQILVVVRGLPKEAEGNDYVVRVSAENGRDYLAEYQFTWSGSQAQRGQSFPVETSKLRAAGGQRFVAKLFAVGNDVPVLTRPFALEPGGRIE